MADILSQDEINALLGEVEGIGEEFDEPESEQKETGKPPPASKRAGISSPPAISDAWDEVDEHSGRNLEIILNIPLQVSAELGRTRMSVMAMLKLNRGAVIQLERMASDLIDLRVNERVVAQGEAVVINEKFGLRVIEVDSLRKRLEKL